MKYYTKEKVKSESALEDLIRQGPGLVEDGLTYVDHQLITAGGRLDMLFVDSGKSLVVAELKVIPDDGMLIQGVDYCDYVTANIDSLARAYIHGDLIFDPKKPVRLMLIAPSFSQTLVNRCKWIDIDISLFSYSCLKFADEPDLVPVFTRQEPPTFPKVPELSTIDEHLKYITDSTARAQAAAFLEEIKNWNAGKIILEGRKSMVSIKVDGTVFAYFHSRRTYFAVDTFNAEGTWTQYPIRDAFDLQEARVLVKAAMESRSISG